MNERMNACMCARQRQLYLFVGAQEVSRAHSPSSSNSSNSSSSSSISKFFTAGTATDAVGLVDIVARLGSLLRC
jgi:hypothetical protein